MMALGSCVVALSSTVGGPFSNWLLAQFFFPLYAGDTIVSLLAGSSGLMMMMVLMMFNHLQSWRSATVPMASS